MENEKIGEVLAKLSDEIKEIYGYEVEDWEYKNDHFIAWINLKDWNVALHWSDIDDVNGVLLGKLDYVTICGSESIKPIALGSILKSVSKIKNENVTFWNITENITGRGDDD